MGRYQVQIKTPAGDWRRKLETDWKDVAVAVTKLGRPCCLVDTQTQETLFETEENGNV